MFRDRYLINSVIGFFLNLLLLYLIRRFSSKELGTYKYLLEIFAGYDTYLVVVDLVINPVTIFIYQFYFYKSESDSIAHRMGVRLGSFLRNICFFFLSL